MKTLSCTRALLGFLAVSLTCSVPTAGAVEFVREWTVSTSFSGEDTPIGLEVDQSGDVYVTTTWAKSVVKCDQYGSRLLSWGGGSEQFACHANSIGLDIGPDGNIYVPDYGRVEVRTPQGQLIRRIGYDLPFENFMGPVTGVAVAADGRVMACDIEQGRVMDFTADGTLLGQWGVDGTSSTRFQQPLSIETDTQGNIIVVDYGSNLIHRFAPDRTPLNSWGGTGNSAGLFNGAGDIAIDAGGQIYVADIDNHRVQVFDSSGGFLWMWGEPGTLPGQFDQPTGIAIGQDGLIYVTDYENLRVQVFTPAVAVRPTTWTQVKLLPSRR
jgi:DNA-binding beta-propeller fold protein YncE